MKNWLQAGLSDTRTNFRQGLKGSPTKINKDKYCPFLHDCSLLFELSRHLGLQAASPNASLQVFAGSQCSRKRSCRAAPLLSLSCEQGAGSAPTKNSQTAPPLLLLALHRLRSHISLNINTHPCLRKRKMHPPLITPVSKLYRDGLT